jgi:hypothetical protein
MEAEIRMFDVPLIDALLHVRVDEHILGLRIVLRKQACATAKQHHQAKETTMWEAHQEAGTCFFCAAL